MAENRCNIELEYGNGLWWAYVKPARSKHTYPAPVFEPCRGFDTLEEAATWAKQTLKERIAYAANTLNDIRMGYSRNGWIANPYRYDQYRLDLFDTIGAHVWKNDDTGAWFGRIAFDPIVIGPFDNPEEAMQKLTVSLSDWIGAIAAKMEAEDEANESD